jgi:uncharacterized damage-inducible protein DinB
MVTPQTRPKPADYASAHAAYVALVPNGNVIRTLERQRKEMKQLMDGIDEAKAGHRYAPGKWTVREVLGHVMDAERVFAYRALCFARGERASQPGFDEQAWAGSSNADGRARADIAKEYDAMRRSTVALLRSFSEEMWDRRGTANNYQASVRGLAWVIAGHELHHVKILRERYLS